MYRIPSGRSQRSRSIKAKHALQVCLLLAVSFWLLYQFKHSRDKKEFDGNDTSTPVGGQTSNNFIRVGRKDIRDGVEESINKNEKHDEILEEEEIEETVENLSEKKKAVEKEEEEIDEPEEEKSDKDDDKEEELVEEKERDEGEGNDIEEKDDNPQINEESNQDGDDKVNHEAREENYKADDASSAVTHEIHENENMQNSTERTENTSEEQANNENSSDEMGEDEMSGNVSFLNKTETEEQNRIEIENGEFSLQNFTQSESELQSNSTLDIENENGVSSSTTHPETKDAEANIEEVSYLSNSTESLASEELRSDVEENDSEKSETDDKDESLESEMNENPEEVTTDAVDESDSSNSLEMKDVRNDLESLPEIQTEGTNTEDAAAE